MTTWVDTADASGTRYFIPLHGPAWIPRDQLVREALAARSERKLTQIKQEDRELRDRFLRKAPILLPLNLALAIASQGHAPPIGETELETFVEEWKQQSSAVKQPGSM